jgi:CRISPR-associated protein Csa3
VVKAYEWIKKLLHTSYGDSVDVELIQLNVMDVEGSIKKVLGKIEEIEDSRIIVNLSGGMRALIVIVLLACMFRSFRNLKIEIETEDFSQVVEFSPALLNLVKFQPGEDKLSILKSISEGAADIKSIAKRINKDESTVRRHISALENIGLVEVRKRKPLLVKATDLAKLLM